MKLRWTTAAAWLLAGANGAVQAETFRCPLADRVVSYQQTPCAVAELAPPRASPPPATAAQPHTDAPFSALTPRKREVLDLTARLERCRSDQPEFAARTERLYQAWRRHHADTLAEYRELLAVKLRVASRGEPAACSDDWVRELESLARPPDPRFASIEGTWQVFVAGLRAADRTRILACVTGPVGRAMAERLEKLPDAELRRMAADIRELRPLWGDDYDREALVVHGDRVDGVVFRRNVNEEWKIRALKPAALHPAAATPRKSSPDS